MTGQFGHDDKTPSPIEKCSNGILNKKFVFFQTLPHTFGKCPKIWSIFLKAKWRKIAFLLLYLVIGCWALEDDIGRSGTGRASCGWEVGSVGSTESGDTVFICSNGVVDAEIFCLLGVRRFVFSSFLLPLMFPAGLAVVSLPSSGHSKLNSLTKFSLRKP